MQDYINATTVKHKCDVHSTVYKALKQYSYIEFTLFYL